jgi:pimeloyl-ACP methyl ester carboxylesterase
VTIPHQLGSFRSDGLTLGYEIHGSGDRPLVYIHGLLLDAAVNRRLARNLADAGNRVILLDMPGHGQSDKPRLASEHRMDTYATHVVRLLDHLKIDRAVIGGMSLGANVTLLTELLAPERVAGMVVEMPVLEQATPYAALLFTPLLGATHLAAPALRFLTSLFRKVPRQYLGPLDQVYGATVLDPDEMVAVLHGILVGPVAPTAEQRERMVAPAMVIGHKSDRLHPFGDASRLARQLPNGRLVEAHSIAELRFFPARLTTEIEMFLDEVWTDESAGRKAG